MAKTDNLSDFLTDVANSIRTKTGETEEINAQDFSDKILSISGGGVVQPTLFAPTTTEGINVISWTNNTNNGGFPVTVTAKIDNTTYTSPLFITEELNNKTLSITASSTNFNNGVTNKTLSYVSAPDYNGGIRVSGLNNDDNNVLLTLTDNSGISIIDATTNEVISGTIESLKQTDGTINSNYITRKDFTSTLGGWAWKIGPLGYSTYSTKNLNVKVYKNGIFMTENTITLSTLPKETSDHYTTSIIPYLAGVVYNGAYYIIWLYRTDVASDKSSVAVNDLVTYQITLSDPE